MLLESRSSHPSLLGGMARDISTTLVYNWCNLAYFNVNQPMFMSFSFVFSEVLIFTVDTAMIVTAVSVL